MLRQVVERPMMLHRVDDWEALKGALRSTSQTAVCFADAMAGVQGEPGLAEGLREVRAEFPFVALVACLRVEPSDAHLLAALQSWGVADVLDLNRENTIAAIAKRLEEVKGVWVQRLLTRAVPRSLSARGRALVELVGNVAAEGGHVPELASALSVYKRTVPRWCAVAGVPEARRIFSWIRLLLAADLLDDHRRSIENIARASGFASAASLKSSTRAFTTLSPSELRERGAFETVATLARSDFRAAKEAARRERRRDNSWYN